MWEPAITKIGLRHKNAWSNNLKKKHVDCKASCIYKMLDANDDYLRHFDDLSSLLWFIKSNYQSYLTW